MPTVAGGGAEPPYGAGDCDSYDGVVVWRKEDLWDESKEDLWDASKASLEAVLGTTRAAIILRKREPKFYFQRERERERVKVYL